jgi:hypothetical protein
VAAAGPARVLVGASISDGPPEAVEAPAARTPADRRLLWLAAPRSWPASSPWGPPATACAPPRPAGGQAAADPVGQAGPPCRWAAHRWSRTSTSARCSVAGTPSGSCPRSTGSAGHRPIVGDLVVCSVAELGTAAPLAGLRARRQLLRDRQS